MTFSVWKEPVQDAWIDYNGHLSEAYYVLALGHATDAVMELIGLGPEYRSTNDASLYTVEAHLRYLEEVPAGSDVEVRHRRHHQAAVDLARAVGHWATPCHRGSTRSARP